MKKLGLIVVVAALAAGGLWKTVLAGPRAPAPKPKIEGTVYILPKDFVLNLARGRFAKLSVARAARKGEGAHSRGASLAHRCACRAGAIYGLDRAVVPAP